MTELVTKIGEFNADNCTVPVTFTYGEIVHDRAVNAVLSEDGKYDAEATAVRISDVARGVEAKISLGVIAVVTPIPEQNPVAADGGAAQ